MTPWRRLLVSLAATALLLAITATPSGGTVTRKKAMWGPLVHDGRPQMPIYADLGVGIWQAQLRWERVAPTRPQNPRDPSDPAYQWPSTIDDAISQGKGHGIEVLLLVQGAPGWANGGKDWSYPPTDAGDYADFVEAAARRYPAVHHWMIWGEPNGPTNFKPFIEDHGRPLPRAARSTAQKYAGILDRAYGRLKAASRRNLVIGGNSWTVGATRPLHWVRAMRLPNGKPPRMDLYGHNPFGPRHPNLNRRPIEPGMVDFSDLDTLERQVNRSLRRSKRGKRIRIFVSEYGLPTDHPNINISYWVSRAAQARYIRDALRITRRTEWLYSFGYYALRDPPAVPRGDQSDLGLITRDGTRKPAYEAFKQG